MWVRLARPGQHLQRQQHQLIPDPLVIGRCVRCEAGWGRGDTRTRNMAGGAERSGAEQRIIDRVGGDQPWGKRPPDAMPRDARPPYLARSPSPTICSCLTASHSSLPAAPPHHPGPPLFSPPFPAIPSPPGSHSVRYRDKSRVALYERPIHPSIHPSNGQASSSFSKRLRAVRPRVGTQANPFSTLMAVSSCPDPPQAQTT